ncbi:MAG: DUF1329 domain-containing protein [Deltaproteobacteria bacterium]|nr:DUF1329 domain-containing protein [Deltaproteobacteria bacterium]
MRRSAIAFTAGFLVIAISSMAGAKLKPGVVITKDNWTKLVGFAPEIPPGYKTGVKIDKSNWTQYKKYIPDGLALLIKKYAMKLWTTKYRPVHPSLGYIKATNKYHRDVSYWDTGKDARTRGIKGYTAGLPFPNPQNGLEVAYDYHYAYNGDDGGFHYGVYWVDAHSGVERSEEWRWLYIIRAMNRTDIPPLPNIPMFEKKDIMYASMTWAIEPYDKAGFGALYYRYQQPKDQMGWIYIPTMRRTMKATFGTRGDAWNSTDMLYEDVRGYMGYPEWMHWKLKAKKTILAPTHSGIRAGKKYRDKTFDFKNFPHWNFKAKWEPRPVYEVEVTPKFKDYPYSKMIIYFDAETFYIPLKIAYDKKGQLWKVLINAFNASPNMDKYPLGIGTSLVIDIQAEHATVFPSYNFKADQGLRPGKFTLTNLRKMAK